VYGGLLPGEDYSSGALLKCLAGITTIGISPQGDIYPCIVLHEPVGNIRDRSLRDIWHTNPVPFLSNLRNMKPGDVSECLHCADRFSCKRCPGIAYLETGDLRNPSMTACMIAKAYNNSHNLNIEKT
jgi:radical SAM protein with 4Fe4S-binding SPASM domain